MKYEVHVAGPGGIDVVTVEADSGDEAASKAIRPGTFVRGVHPAPVDAVVTKAKPRNG
jgi:hypothetical protein